MKWIRNKAYMLLRKSERLFKTDMVYLARGGFWMNANLVLLTIFSFLLSITFARFLSKDDYGIYQFILSVSTVLTALTLTGMNNAITQSVARGLEGSFIKSIPVQLKHNVLPFIVGLAIAGYYYAHGNARLGLGIVIISLLLPVYNTFNTYTAFITGKKDFKTGFIVGQGVNIPYYAVMIASVYFIKDPLILVLVNFGINTVLSIIFYIYTIRKYKPNKEEDAATIKYGKELSLVNVLSLLASQADSLLVFHYIGAAELAVYTFATTIPERMNGLFKSVSVAAFPKFSEKTREELQPTILSKSVRLTLITLIITLIYVALAPLLFHIFFPQYIAAVFYSQVYALMLVLSYLSSLPAIALMATRSRSQLYTYNFISPIVSITTMFVLINLFGIWGLIFSRGISNLANFFILLILWKK